MFNKVFRHFFFAFILLSHLCIGVAYAWKEVALGSGFTLAIDDNGALWAWGDNAWGTLGIGNSNNLDNYPPQKIGSDTNWLSLQAGNQFALALKDDGTIWAWGYNFFGQLGQGNNQHQYEPIQIGTDSDWQFISANGNQTFAIKLDGTLWGWGDNSFGQLGDGTRIDQATPVQIGEQKWTKIASGGSHTLGIQQDGSLWSWGSNSNGPLGLGCCDRGLQIDPVRIGVSDDWKEISAGRQHSLAIKDDGTLWSWGVNSQYELGLNENMQIRFSPVQVGSKSDWQSVKAGTANSFAIDENGTLYSWGYRLRGLLGLGEDEIAHVPTALESELSWKTISTSSAPEAWSYHAAGIKNDDSLWLWGDYEKGELGFEATQRQFTPQKLPAFDSDNDGVADDLDAFPNDPTETQDSDSDGVGDNADVFPNDATETLDSDSDGVGDNADVFPNDATETQDSDSDGVGDNADAFPNDATETQDSDSDGVGDNADAFPNDASETQDSDSDGVGDNADAFPNDATETKDSDSDGVGDNADAFPNDATETKDSDSDGVGDNADAFPNDASRSRVSVEGETKSDGGSINTLYILLLLILLSTRLYWSDSAYRT